MGEHVKLININSNDELGNLARNMEIMSDSIQKSHDELEIKVKERTSELQKSLSDIKTLKGILPICSSCKKIRDDKGAWNQIEEYIQANSDIDFSHGLCQECAEKLYPDIDT